MEKYGTYNVYQNVDTKEIKRIPLADEKEMTKTANQADWKILDKDPEEEENESKGHETQESA